MRINVPTKTQLYIDQARRERENAQSMYKVFQQDLASLQLIAARQYAKVVSKKMTATVTVEDVQMQVRVLKRMRWGKGSKSKGGALTFFIIPCPINAGERRCPGHWTAL